MPVLRKRKGSQVNKENKINTSDTEKKMSKLDKKTDTKMEESAQSKDSKTPIEEDANLKAEEKCSTSSSALVNSDTNVATTTDVQKISGHKMSLISASKIKKEKPEGPSELPSELQTLLSRLYMDAGGRLGLRYPPRCAKDLFFCHSNHFRNPMPETLNRPHMPNLLCAWQQGRYGQYIQIVADMCVRCEFPGKGVFTKLIELVLSSNYERSGTDVSKRAYLSVLRLFRSLITTFPPCWYPMRARYLNFFQRGLDLSKFAFSTQEPISNSHKIFDILFDMLDHTYSHYEKYKSNEEQENQIFGSQNTSSIESSVLKSQNSFWNTDSCDGGSDVFLKLNSDSRLERLNSVLSLLAQILETDLVMWLIHHRRKVQELMFNTEKAPLVVLVFDMIDAVRLSRSVKRVFTLFSKATSIGLSKAHLKVLERFVALIMVVSHAADIEISVIGIKFPFLQSSTKKLIKDFYKIFKAENPNSLSQYFTAIDLFRIPYVKIEFIDNFLHSFQHTQVESMTPMKITNNILRKLWQGYKPKAEIENPDEELSREQYFALLLKALRAYDAMFGLQTVLQYLAFKKPIQPFQTVSDSIHHTPNRGRTKDVLVLEDMAKDKDIWYKQLRMHVRMGRPKVNLPPADICVDKEVLASYRNALKNCCCLLTIMEKYADLDSSADFREWFEFLSSFKVEEGS